ncbi:MAG: phosphoribosylamine--glycine ligase, partial [Acidimicrobiia bacterium]|nr:phosphoribosylamine--glycine ligase [Acidimicrobiia bacterium]
MRVLLLGSGGREHAIGWKLAQSPLLTELISCPGNPGLAHHGRTVTEVDPTDPMAVASLAVEEAVDLVVIGPEAPLAAGVADALRQAGVPVFGPGADGAMLEASKSFANDIMAAAGVPTGASWTFSDRATAIAHLRSMTGPYVVKADGLAAGKGVLVCASLDDAEAWVDRCLDGSFGPDGGTVVIEEHMTGDEVSVFFLCAAGT